MKAVVGNEIHETFGSAKQFQEAYYTIKCVLNWFLKLECSAASIKCDFFSTITLGVKQL
jgi:hypothetical protein